MKHELTHLEVPRMVVVGGGVSGLAAAHRLTELARQQGRSIDLTLLDASDRWGGVIHTIRNDGYLIEAGPDNFITMKPWAMNLVVRLGLTDELLQTNDAHRRALVVRKGRLHPIPEGFLMMAPTRWFGARGIRSFPAPRNRLWRAPRTCSSTSLSNSCPPTSASPTAR